LKERSKSSALITVGRRNKKETPEDPLVDFSHIKPRKAFITLNKKNIKNKNHPNMLPAAVATMMGIITKKQRKGRSALSGMWANMGSTIATFMFAWTIIRQYCPLMLNGFFEKIYTQTYGLLLSLSSDFLPRVQGRKVRE
jgi:hypothetical protein